VTRRVLRAFFRVHRTAVLMGSEVGAMMKLPVDGRTTVERRTCCPGEEVAREQYTLDGSGLPRRGDIGLRSGGPQRVPNEPSATPPLSQTYGVRPLPHQLPKPGMAEVAGEVATDVGDWILPSG